MSELSGSSSAWFRVLIHASMHFSSALAKWLQMDRQLQQCPPDRIATLPRTKRNPNPCYAKGIACSINASANYFTFTTQKVKTWLQICEMVQAYPRNQKLKFCIILFCPCSQFIAINVTCYLSTLDIKSSQVACSSCICRRRRSTCWDPSKSLVLPGIWITYLHPLLISSCQLVLQVDCPTLTSWVWTQFTRISTSAPIDVSPASWMRSISFSVYGAWGSSLS